MKKKQVNILLDDEQIKILTEVSIETAILIPKIKIMNDKYYLINIISSDYDLIRKTFCGKTDKEIINTGAESIEDIFHDKLLSIIQNYPNHFLPVKSDEIDFIIKTLRVKASQKRQIVTIEYNDYFENRAPDEPEPDYSEKLQLLLIHYQPDIIRHKKAS